jgi:hypothetical protein
MPGEPHSIQSVDALLAALGFSRGDDGTLHAPDTSRITLAPVGQFFELRISLDTGAEVTAVLSKAAVKITREGSKP